MPIDISDIRSTIVPKSDQMNYEDLIAGPRTITVTDVRPGNDEQPLIIHYHGDAGHPYKPNKTWRKALAFAWGPDARQWIGKSMTVMGDATVKWGGVEVGGIVISHLSDIPKDLELSLSATRGKRVKHRVQLLQVTKAPTLQEVLAAIDSATNKAGMDKAKAMAKELIDDADLERALKAYADKVQALKGGKPATEPAGKTLEQLKASVESSPDRDTAELQLDLARHLPESEQDELATLIQRKFD